MTDIHCHILPGVDDGAEKVEQSVEMARMAWQSGVHTIIATPHCNLPGETGNYRSGAMTRRFNTLQKAVDEAGIPVKILPGAEVLGTPQVPQLLDEKKLITLAGSRYLLVEFFFDEHLSQMDFLLEAIAARGYVPVIAHPERYEAVQQAPHVVARWFHHGYVIQLNKGSILGRLGRRTETCAHWLLTRGLAHVVASDAHSDQYRTPHMSQLVRLLEAEYGGPYTDILLRTNPGNIARNLPMLQADEP